MRTDGIFWRSSYATLASRLPHFHLCSPEMPKELHLFCRLGLYRILCFFHLHAVKNIIIEKKDIFFSGLFLHAASRPLFVVVTSAKLALKVGVDDISQVAYHCLNQAVLVM